VLDTRTGTGAIPGAVKRRRQCLSCGFRFSTLEVPVREEITVLKRDGSLEEFDRQKIVAGLQCALKKGNRRREEVEALADRVVRQLLAPRPVQLTAEEIGNAVMGCLRDYDPLAYARFLSVHRSFADLEEFQKTLGQISHGNPV
jgi:transcriptional repressor NrdR